MANPFVLITPASRGLSRALTRHYLSTTEYTVYATHRSSSEAETTADILSNMPQSCSPRLRMLYLDLACEQSIAAAAQNLQDSLPRSANSFIHTAFLTGGILIPEKHSSDISVEALTNTFRINVISHLLLIKHFSRFLPSSKSHPSSDAPSKWVHVTARVGSISDNKRGGWYSYRSSKAALNQVIKTFDRQLEMNRVPAISVGVHPGTVKTDLSSDFWNSVPSQRLFEPDLAAKQLSDVVQHLNVNQRGKVWDWEGKEVLP